jgi:hypothetical protein
MKMIKTIYLALSLVALNSCNYEREVKREDYDNMPGSLFHKNAIAESMFFYDVLGDGKIDLIRYGHETHPQKTIVAIDSTLFAEGFSAGNLNRTIPLTKEMSDLATKITELQRELNFKIDSTYATKKFLRSNYGE